MPGRYRHRARRFSLPAWLPGLVLGFAAGVLVTWALFPPGHRGPGHPHRRPCRLT